MIIVPIKEGENIERALKKFKRKFEKTGAPTGIKSLDVEEEGTLKDGKYFIKDKIVIVKNGKMYNAAGGLQK